MTRMYKQERKISFLEKILGVKCKPQKVGNVAHCFGVDMDCNNYLRYAIVDQEVCYNICGKYTRGIMK